MLYFGIPLKCVDQIETIDVGKTRNEIDPRLLYGCQDVRRPFFRVRFTHWYNRAIAPLFSSSWTKLVSTNLSAEAVFAAGMLSPKESRIVFTRSEERRVGKEGRTRWA